MFTHKKSNFFSVLLLLFAMMITSMMYGQLPILQGKNTLSKAELPNIFVDESLEDRDKLEEQLSNQIDKVGFHLFSHGQPGQLFINNQWLSNQNLVAFLQPLLQDKKHLNIYGCHFAQGEKGRAAVVYLETALGISVAASDDLTGVDGDWDLEVGNFKNGVTIQEYSHNLQQGTLPIQPGMAATTCGSYTEANQFNSDPNGYVFGIFDIREPGCPGTPGANAPNAPANWAGASGSNAYHDSRWTNTNLGEVFGVDLEYDQASSPDIFLSSCGLSSWHNSDQYPMTGGTGGEVFRIDGTTGDITVLATLPSTVYASATGRDKFTGLGNLSYNADQQKVYVTNLDNGYIHVVDATTTGMIDQTYDPTPGIPEASFEAYEYTRRTRLVYGIEYNKCDKRLYFARPNTLTTVDILSVGLNADGTIGASTPTLETTVTVETNVVISDIEFSDDCMQMLTSERQLVVATTSNVFLLQTAPHFSDVKRHDLSGGTWSLASTSYSIGNCPSSTCTISDKNAGGGVSFGYGNYGACGTDNACADAMVATSDALVYSSGLNIYGLQISDIDGTSSGLTNSYFVDLDGNTGSSENADKSTSFDVDVFGVNDCSVVSCSIDTDGLASVSCTGTNAITFSLTPTGTSVGGTYNVSVSGGGATSISPTSGAYDAMTTFTLNDNSAGGGDVTVTLTDVTDNSCTRDVTVTDPGTCLASCSIDTDGLASVSCTGTNAITFSLTPTGTSVGGTYNASVSGGGATSIIPTSGAYDAMTTFTLNDNSGGSGNVTVTLTDVTDNSCTRDVTVTDPGTCLASCSLSMSQSSTCSESGGVYTQTYDLTLNWTGPPATGGLTITLTGDGTLNTSTVSAATLAGGSTTTLPGAFTVPADGNGTTTITATFDDDSACTSTFTLKAPVPCPADVNPCASTAGCIGGNVFEDFNCNGVDDTEPGVQGVQIQVYDCNNNLVGTGYSDSEGDWQVCGLTDGTAYRIEHVLPESVACWATPTHVGTDNGSDIQFLTAPACTQFSVSSPSDYCEVNPKLLTTCFVIGDPDDATVAGQDVLVEFNYDGTGKAVVDVAGNVGSTWGVAFDQQNQRYFVSTVLRRHSGIADNLGTIYVADPISGTPTVFTTLSNVGTIASNTDRGLTTLTAPSQDQQAFSKIGKVGIGDIDLSEDGSTLYAVNLNTRKVVAINTTSLAETELPAFPEPGCGSGVARPWALKVYRGAIYLGLVCSGENGGSQSDLSAHIMKYENGSWSTKLSFDLDYNKACSYDYFGTTTGCGGWSPWFDDDTTDPPADYIFGYEFFSYPTPIFSDLEFTEDGSILMAFLDRSAMQYSAQNHPPYNNTNDAYEYVSGGDILVAHNVNGNLIFENNGASGEPTTTGQSNGQGPNGGEFIYEDEYLSDDAHYEVSTGGIAVLKGTNEFALSRIDPSALNSGGIGWFGSTTGQSTNTLELYAGGIANGFMSKSAGIGDIELLCAPAPLEIGNYVWCDSLANGIQDACERGISGINVSLYDRNGALVGVTTTSATGQYYFNENNVDTTGVDAAGVANNAYTGMSYATQYFIVFGAGGQFTTDQFTVGGEMYGITAMANTGSNDNIDSDVDGSNLSTALLDMPAGLPYIDMTTSATGCGDHKYDLGVTCTAPTYSLGNQVFTDTDNSGDLNGVETGIDGVNLQLLNSDGSVYDSDPNTAGDQALTVTTANGGYYRFDDLPAGDYIVEVVATNFTSGNNLENFLSSTGANQEADPDTDGDLNDNGLDTQVSGATRSAVVTLGTPEPTGEAEPGTYVAGSTTGIAAADLFSNLTVDFGFYSCPTLVLSGTKDPTTCSGIDGDIQLSGLAASTAYSLNFIKDGVAQTAQNIMSNGSGEYVITGLDAAAYTAINVTAAGCTSNDVMATLADPIGPTSCSIIGTDPTTAGGTDGTADLTVVGGTAAYTFAWSNSETTEDLTSLSAGTYSVIVTDANSCTTTCSVTLTDPAGGIGIDYPDFANANNICPDSPCHIIDDNIYLGISVTDDSSGGGSSTADSDIDDALSLGTNFNVVPGGNLTIPVTLFNDTGNDAYFRFWMDWNADGDFDDAGEQVANNTYPATSNNGSFIVQIPITVPTDVAISSLALRLRFSTDDTNSATPCGTGTCAADGEIEDYLIQVTCPTAICLPVQLIIKSGNP